MTLHEVRSPSRSAAARVFGPGYKADAEAFAARIRAGGARAYVVAVRVCARPDCTARLASTSSYSPFCPEHR